MIAWRERLKLILAIVDKDRRVPLWVWITVLLLSISVFGFMFSVASNVATNPYGRFTWRWGDGPLRSYYVVSAILTSVILGLTFSHFHQGEVQRGTIRSIVLYPVDMNDLTIAKLLSSLIVSAILSTVLFLGIFGPWFLLGLYPFADFLAIHLMALAMSFFALAVGVFLAQGLAQFAGRMVLTPTALGVIFLLLALMFTETGLTAIGLQIASFGHPGGALSFAEFTAVVQTARSLSVLSPHHVGARILGIAFGLTGLWADLHVVLPIAALVIAGGYWLGKKLYLDIFVR